MTLLILGLVLFLGVHSTRIVAEGWRTQMLAKLGPNGWKGLYSVLSIVGFVLIVQGYGAARLEPTVLWGSPTWVRMLASLLTLGAFVLLVATYVPRNGIKARLRHPMVLAVKVWAIAHLLANNTLADLVLFGSFLLWAVFSFRAARGRDRAANAPAPASALPMTLLTVAVGLVAWAVFAFWAHLALFGVHPFMPQR
jgi:uncharacterized membrane protein